MAALLAFGLLGAAALAMASPLVDVEKTSLSLDRRPELLDEGHITVHLARVDDLIDDQADDKLLLERKTHIAVNIQLDQENGALSVNGENVPLNTQEQDAVALTAVKAQTFSLPVDMPSDFYHPDHVNKLVDSLSTGIVSLQIRLTSEIVPVDALGSKVSDNAFGMQAVNGLSYRKIGLFMRLTEVEGKSVQHHKDICAPIVQLIMAQDSANGAVQSVNTLSVAGKPVVAGAQHHNTGTIFNPAAQKQQQNNHNKSHGQEAGGLWGLIKSMINQPRPSDKQHHHKGGKKPCKGPNCVPPLSPNARLQAGIRKGKALAHHNHDDDNNKQAAHQGRPQIPSGPPHRTGQIKHLCHRLRNFFAHFVQVFLQSAFFLVVVGVVFGGITFKIMRVIIRRRAARAAAREELPPYDGADADYDEEVKDDKFEVVQMEPPAYASEEHVPLFDADERSSEDNEARRGEAGDLRA